LLNRCRWRLEVQLYPIATAESFPLPTTQAGFSSTAEIRERAG
jgi:hypothetical protein